MEIYIAPGWNKCYFGSTLEEIISQAEKDMFERMEGEIKYITRPREDDEDSLWELYTSPRMSPRKTRCNGKIIELHGHYTILDKWFEKGSKKTKCKGSLCDRHSCTMTLRRQPT